MGAAAFIRGLPRWSIINLDTGEVIKGQFQAENFTENIAGVWAQSATAGRPQPILQFVRGESETMSFKARFWAKHEGLFGLGADDLFQQVEAVKELARPQSGYNRPPQIIFNFGRNIGAVAIVESVGGIEYDQPRPISGTLRGVSFNISLRRFMEYFGPEITDPTAPPIESRMHLAKQGDSFELLSQREYGSAIHGDYLRWRHPELAPLEPGDVVHVFPKRNVTNLVMTPRSIPLAKNDDTRDLKLEFLALRGRTKKSRLIFGDL